MSNLPNTPTTQTTFLSTEHLVEIVHRKTLQTCLAGVAARIESDFLRWAEFDKSPRVACHSPEGVIELMPIADASDFAFKYVNGHPKNLKIILVNSSNL